jgi:penicillin-binding protein 1A
MSKVSSKTKPKKKIKVGKIILLIFFFMFLIITSAVIGVSVAVVKSSPEISSNILLKLKQSSKIYDMNGKYIEDYSDSQVRSVASLNQINPTIQDAFIAIEDERFREHPGIDIKRIFGALYVDIKTRSNAQGASTITQQLVKNVFLTQEKKITRKIQEAYMSIMLERKLSKDQILEAYLNTIYLGGSSYGVEAAAMNYFGKDTMHLTLSQSAFLAGLNKNPLKYYPYNKNNYTPRSKANTDPYDPTKFGYQNQYFSDPIYRNLYIRRDVVLKKMLDLRKIDQIHYQQALAEKLVFTSTSKPVGIRYQWFIEPAIDKIAEDFSSRYGLDKNEAKQKLRVGGYSIYLTIDPKIQNAAETTINDSKNYSGIRLSSKNKKYTSDKSENATKFDQPQASAVIFDYSTGEMRAIVGGRGKHPQLSINRATSVPRQPGSSIKPLAVYGPAIDTKLATAGTIIKDSPMSTEFVNSHNGWNPHNYETKKFSGAVTIRNAIKNSINIVAIKLANELNPDPASGVVNNKFGTSIDYLQNKFHLSTIKTSGSNSDLGLSPLALGALTEGVYPYEMAAAYGVFGNNGMYSSPILYTKVVDNMDNVVLEASSEKSQSISPQSAYIMLDMMKGVVKSGTGTKASIGRIPVAGKTGTAADFTNLWFCGVTPYYSGAVWIGHDKPSVALNGLHSSNAAVIWSKIMKKAHENLAYKDFVKPGGIVTSPVCKDSGKFPNEICYKKSRVVNEIYIDGTQPIEICNYHKTNQTIPTIDPALDNTDNEDNTNTIDTTGNGVDVVPPSQP